MEKLGGWKFLIILLKSSKLWGARYFSSAAPDANQFHYRLATKLKLTRVNNPSTFFGSLSFFLALLSFVPEVQEQASGDNDYCDVKEW